MTQQEETGDVYAGFEPAGYAAWKARAVKEAGGEEAFQNLFKTSAEGITTQPYYTLNDLDGREFGPVLKPAAGWKVVEHVTVTNPTEAFQQAAKVIERGADEVIFIVNNGEHINGLTPLPANAKIWLNDWVNIYEKATTENVLCDALMLAETKGETGNVQQILETANYSALVDAAVYHNAGAETCTQIAIALAHANEYLGMGIHHLTFNFSVGSNYFFEIAKLRAFRKLYALMVKEYGLDDETVIYCETALNNKTIYDYNNNILRSTTEAMAAIIGGCDAMYVHPYDVLFKQPNDFSARIARNVQLVLRHEAYMDMVQDAAAGSFYLENLTEDIAAKSWELFKDLEARGGWLECIRGGYLQKVVEEQSLFTQKAADEGTLAILGVNKYPDKNQRMKAEIELVQLPRNEFFPLRRFAETTEQSRLNNE